MSIGWALWHDEVRLERLNVIEVKPYSYHPSKAAPEEDVTFDADPRIELRRSLAFNGLSKSNISASGTLPSSGSNDRCPDLWLSRERSRSKK